MRVSRIFPGLSHDLLRLVWNELRPIDKETLKVALCPQMRMDFDLVMRHGHKQMVDYVTRHDDMCCHLMSYDRWDMVMYLNTTKCKMCKRKMARTFFGVCL